MGRVLGLCPLYGEREEPCGQPATTAVGLPLIQPSHSGKTRLWIGPWCWPHAEALAGVAGIEVRRFAP